MYGRKDGSLVGIGDFWLKDEFANNFNWTSNLVHFKRINEKKKKRTRDLINLVPILDLAKGPI
jgi:hypothetical protein